VTDRRSSLIGRTWKRVRRAYTLQPGQENLGTWPQVVLALGAVVIGTFMILIGNRLLGNLLLRLIGPNHVVQFIIGLAWLFVGVGLGLQSDRASRPGARTAMKVACGLMVGLTWLVTPLGRGMRVRGAGEYIPFLKYGQLLSIPVTALIWWLIMRRPWRR